MTHETIRVVLLAKDKGPADDENLASMIDREMRQKIYHCVVCGKKAQGGRLFCHEHRKAQQQPVSPPQPSPRPMQFVAGENWRSDHADNLVDLPRRIDRNGWDDLVKIYEDAQDGL